MNRRNLLKASMALAAYGSVSASGLLLRAHWPPQPMARSNTSILLSCRRMPRSLRAKGM